MGEEPHDIRAGEPLLLWQTGRSKSVWSKLNSSSSNKPLNGSLWFSRTCSHHTFVRLPEFYILPSKQDTALKSKSKAVISPEILQGTSLKILLRSMPSYGCRYARHPHIEAIADNNSDNKSCLIHYLCINLPFGRKSTQVCVMKWNDASVTQR